MKNCIKNMKKRIKTQKKSRVTISVSHDALAQGISRMNELRCRSFSDYAERLILHDTGSDRNGQALAHA